MSRLPDDPTWDEAAQWVDRGEESAALHAWLAADPAHNHAYNRLAAVMSDPALTEALALQSQKLPATPSDLSGRWEYAPARPRRIRWLPLTAMAAAASLIGVGLPSLLEWPRLWQAPTSPAPVQVVTTQPGQLRTVSLADGSRIHLNGGTSLAVSLRKNEREARLLRGEALFDIRHDANHPFTLQLAKGKLVDLGTVFNVGTAGGHVTVEVYSGKVRLEGDRAATIAAGQQASLDGGRISSVSGFDPQAGDWRSGWIEPRDWPLARVVEALRRRTRTAIIIDSPALGAQRITGRLHLDDPREELVALADLYGFSVHERPGQIVLAASRPD